MCSDPKAAMTRDIQVMGKRRTHPSRMKVGVGQVVKVGEGEDPSSRRNNQCKSLEGGVTS